MYNHPSVVLFSCKTDTKYFMLISLDWIRFSALEYMCTIVTHNDQDVVADSYLPRKQISQRKLDFL